MLICTLQRRESCQTKEGVTHSLTPTYIPHSLSDSSPDPTRLPSPRSKVLSPPHIPLGVEVSVCAQLHPGRAGCVNSRLYIAIFWLSLAYSWLYSMFVHASSHHFSTFCSNWRNLLCIVMPPQRSSYSSKFIGNTCDNFTAVRMHGILLVSCPLWNSKLNMRTSTWLLTYFSLLCTVSILEACEPPSLSPATNGGENV